jgi:hypothetical protein
MRHSLTDKSIQAATIVGSWSEYPGLIPSDKLAAAFNEKSKRLKGKNKEGIDQAGTPSDSLLSEVIIVG